MLKFFKRIIEMLLISLSIISSYIRRIPSTKQSFNHLRTMCVKSSSTTSNDMSIQSTRILTAIPLSNIDLKGLKSEISRIYLRTFKKITKCNEKLAKYSITTTPTSTSTATTLTTNTHDEDTISIINEIKQELEQLQTYLTSLNNLELQLKEIRTVNDKSFPSIIQLATKLSITDTPPPKQERGEKKPKNTIKHEPRKPYFPYKSVDNIIIRVGREAPDNDVLSCDPTYRLPSEWWLHVSGYPGSHVVIRCSDDDLPDSYRETLKDAAILAAVNSKASCMGKTI